LAIAFAASFGINRLMPTAITPAVVALAMSMALMTGLVAGFMPAWRAARMNPVDALRAE
jgi:putative ABC transport system permease protein